jgi:splicing factor 3B subunit 3
LFSRLCNLADIHPPPSLTVVTFHSQPENVYLVVGTAVNMTLSPRGCSKGYLRLYRFSEDGNTIEPVHNTEITDIPKAMIPFQGRLLVGVGNALRIYDLGKRKLLRKAETKVIGLQRLPSDITE